MVNHWSTFLSTIQLPLWHLVTPKPSTFDKSANSALREQNLINKACIVDASGKQTFPETNTISFGTAATIRAKGMFVGKVAAEVSWNGKTHVLKRGHVMFCQGQRSGCF